MPLGVSTGSVNVHAVNLRVLCRQLHLISNILRVTNEYLSGITWYCHNTITATCFSSDPAIFRLYTVTHMQLVAPYGSTVE